MTASARDWAAEETGSGCVERMTLRDGVILILSRFAPTDPRAFDFVEPEDTVGIGFHLRGGARFHSQSEPVETAPFDIWRGMGREGTTSRFELPAGGFRTVSIRMTGTERSPVPMKLVALCRWATQPSDRGARLRPWTHRPASRTG